MLKPPYADLKAFFQTLCRWQAHDMAAWTVGFSSGAIYDCGQTIATGDVRRAYNALVWRTRMGQVKLDNDTFLNPFEATRRLLLRRIDFAEWATRTEPRDIDLVRHHLVSYTDTVHDLADALDAMSACDDGSAIAAHVAALVVQTTSTASSVTTLVPPRVPRCTAPAPSASHSCLSRRAFAAEVPVLLRATSS